MSDGKADFGHEGMPERAGPWEYAVAASLLALGIYVALEGLGYGIGTVRRMGPGFVPLGVGAALALLAAGILAELATKGGARRIDWPVRTILFVLAAMLVFAALVERAGIVPTTFALVVVGSFADEAMTPLRAVTSGIVLAGIGWLVFIRGFGLPLDPFWW